MSWNRPDESKVVNKGKGLKRSNARANSLVVVGVAVVVGASAFLYFALTSNKESSNARRPSSTPKLIKEVSAAVAPTNAPETSKEEIPFWKVDASQTNGFTRSMMRKWKIEHRKTPSYVGKRELLKKSAWHIFEHKSENHLAGLLCAEPGANFIGGFNYKGFNEDFLKSCTEPIIVSEDDTDFVKDLKRRLNALKIELKPRIEAGEDLGKIIEDTREEYRKLAIYKNTLAKEMRDLINGNAQSVEDVDAFEAAANKMLESKGIAPMKMSAITKQMLLSRAQERRNKANQKVEDK